MITLEVRGLTKKNVEIEENCSIASVRDAIGKSFSVSACEILLYNSGVPLHDDMMVSDLTTPIVDMNIPLLGGKVHGSLARAGKVKGQTPKVEKQDKKKKKTGRAKRRMQYNRRFVNVVATFGRKKGPNANS